MRSYMDRWAGTLGKCFPSHYAGFFFNDAARDDGSGVHSWDYLEFVSSAFQTNFCRF